MEQIQTELSFEGLTHFFDFGKEVEKFKIDIFAQDELLQGDIEMMGYDVIDEFFDRKLTEFEYKFIQEWNNNLEELDIDLMVNWDGSIAPIDKKNSNR
jgi:hypothetical protein